MKGGEGKFLTLQNKLSSSVIDLFLYVLFFFFFFCTPNARLSSLLFTFLVSLCFFNYTNKMIGGGETELN